MAGNNQNNETEQKEYFKDRAGTDEARFHAVPHDDEGWAVKREGQDEPEFTSGSKSEVVNEAKKLAEDAGTMAYIHDEDGQIEDQYNYSN
ncbi:DUF2188 domain-containing protein [Bacillus sp. REN3]|uniref:DUF2188 domain-containing protein n=1 Tax=Bacillus sp. REN3 TaxID=2802440 RepID=UPI001AED3EA9|nr:DUF2188 domain-containing protein [Bacillus sp. REN3]